jgi:hypothetical protein
MFNRGGKGELAEAVDEQAADSELNPDDEVAHHGLTVHGPGASRSDDVQHVHYPVRRSGRVCMLAPF